MTARVSAGPAGLGGTSALSLRQVSLSLGGRPVLENVSLEVGRGEVVALLGRSGSGKTTLLRLAAGLLNPDQGAVTRRAGDLRVGGRVMVFQDARLLPWLTLRGNLELVSPPALHGDVTGWLERVGLGGREALYPGQLSLGMAQRVAVARALLLRPSLLLLDEPHSALDELTAAELRGLLGRLLAESGASALLVTHNPAEAAELADRVLVLGGQPARVMGEHRLGQARPRHPDDPALWAEVLALRALLRAVEA